jgi:Mn2+/Fe2+ NRAMP family transporter
MAIGRIKLLRWFSLFGPGTLVMLADTDAGSLILSAQSGAAWGYSLLLLQIILIPVLYIVQELTVRLGITTGLGHGELIQRHFGKIWAYISVFTLVICCVGALLTELSGLAAVGELFNIPSWKTMLVVTASLIAIAWSNSYHSLERIAIFIGLFEIIFIGLALQSKPDIHLMAHSAFNIPWHNTSYLYLVAGNIGAVIMPWMIFFQQSAILDKGLTTADLKTARWDTAIGACLTQIIMCSVLILAATTFGKTAAPINDVQQISEAIIPALGSNGLVLFALGMTGAAIVATLVVTLTAAWGIGEVMGFRRSLGDAPQNAPWFYGFYTLILAACATVISINGKNLVSLSVGIEVMNAILLPLVLGFLFLLARKALPEPYRLRGWYAIVVGIILFITSAFGMFGGLFGMLF